MIWLHTRPVAIPVVAEAEAPVGLLHGGDVLQGPLARMALVGDGGVFGGQAEGVPAHGVQHVERRSGGPAAKLALNMLHRELMDLNPSAARSLSEGMEETLTVHRLHVPTQLRKTLASTNVIESAFSIVEQVCKNVKRWHGGDQRERWVGSGLLVAQKQFRRVTGYKQIPALIRELEALAPPKPEVAKRRKVS